MVEEEAVELVFDVVVVGVVACLCKFQTETLPSSLPANRRAQSVSMDHCRLRVLGPHSTVSVRSVICVVVIVVVNTGCSRKTSGPSNSKYEQHINGKYRTAFELFHTARMRHTKNLNGSIYIRSREYAQAVIDLFITLVLIN